MMKPISFTKNSWHYWIATRFGDLRGCYSTDFCYYMRQVFRGIFVATLMLSLASIVTTLIVSGIITIVAKTFGLVLHLPLILQTGGVFAVGIVAAVFAMVCCAFIADWIIHIVRCPKKSLGFIRQAYTSWREKLCVRVDFIKD